MQKLHFLPAGMSNDVGNRRLPTGSIHTCMYRALSLSNLSLFPVSYRITLNMTTCTTLLNLVGLVPLNSLLYFSSADLSAAFRPFYVGDVAPHGHFYIPPGCRHCD